MEENQQSKNKKLSLLIVGIAILVIGLVGVTYAFFNYTRTGQKNVIKTGRIAFETSQNGAFNLSNMFPIEATQANLADNTKVGTVTIDVSGDTTYSRGIEYLVTAVNVQNTVGSGANQKTVPISIQVTYEAKENKDIGTASNSYFADRGGNTSYYKVLSSDTVNDGDRLIVGYIKPDDTGIDGTITVKAYLDKDKVAITDTYPERTIRTVKSTGYTSAACETALTGVSGASTMCATTSSLQTAIDGGDLTEEQISALISVGLVEEYTDGTTSTWVDNRVVLTTAEWNSLQANGVSFQVRVEANEGIWVKEQIKYNANGGTVSPAYKEIDNDATTYGSLPTPTAPEGYSFDGWYTAATVGTLVEASTAYTAGTSATTLYAHYSEIPTIDSCPGCKFMYTTNSYQYGGTNNPNATQVSTLSGVTTNYTTLNKNYFLGFTEVDDGNGNMVIDRAFACGIKGEIPNQGATFCIEGTTDGSKYSDNVILLQGTDLWNGGCSGTTTLYCSGTIFVPTSNSGDASVRDSSNGCFANHYGNLGCN